MKKYEDSFWYLFFDITLLWDIYIISMNLKVLFSSYLMFEGEKEMHVTVRREKGRECVMCIHGKYSGRVKIHEIQFMSRNITFDTLLHIL